MLAELSLVQAISAAGRAWDQALIYDGDRGLPGIAWVEIGTTGASSHVAVALAGRKVGRLLEDREDCDGFYRVFAESLFDGPTCHALGPQEAACHAFAKGLTEAGCVAHVRTVLL